MKVTIVSVDGSTVTVHDFDPLTVLDLIEEFQDPATEVLHFSLSEGRTETYVLRRNIVRIDVDLSRPVP